MADKILLPQQKISFNDLLKQIPAHGFPFQKLIFQCELRSLTNGDATFGIIGYPAWRNGQNKPWNIGKKVIGEDIKEAGPEETFSLEPNTAFGNIEISLSKHALVYDQKEIKYESNQDVIEKFIKIVQDLSDKKISLVDYYLTFKPKLYTNPHSDYKVTLDPGGFPAATNPSPPADPSEA